MDGLLLYGIVGIAAKLRFDREAAMTSEATSLPYCSASWLHGFVSYYNMCTGRGDILCVVVHDHRHTVHVETVRLGHHSLTETVCYMIAAQKSGEDSTNLEGNKAEGSRVPTLEDESLEFDIRRLAARED